MCFLRGKKKSYCVHTTWGSYWSSAISSNRPSRELLSWVTNSGPLQVNINLTSSHVRCWALGVLRTVTPKSVTPKVGPGTDFGRKTGPLDQFWLPKLVRAAKELVLPIQNWKFIPSGCMWRHKCGVKPKRVAFVWKHSMNWSCLAIGCTNRDTKETKDNRYKVLSNTGEMKGKTVVKFNK